VNNSFTDMQEMVWTVIVLSGSFKPIRHCSGLMWAWSHNADVYCFIDIRRRWTQGREHISSIFWRVQYII